MKPKHALPDPIARLVDAVNGGDNEAFLQLFTSDAVVDDWGRRFIGPDAIRDWSREEFVGAHGRLTVLAVTETTNVVVVDADWRSNFYSGTSRFIFTLSGARVRLMAIPAR